VNLATSSANDLKARALCLALSYLLDDGDLNKPLLRKIALETNRREVQLLGKLRQTREGAAGAGERV